MKTRKANTAQKTQFITITRPIYAELASALRTDAAGNTQRIDEGRFDAAAQQLRSVCDEHGFHLAPSGLRMVVSQQSAVAA